MEEACVHLGELFKAENKEKKTQKRKLKKVAEADGSESSKE